MKEEEITNDQQKYYAINTTYDKTSLTSVLIIHSASSDAVFKCQLANWGGTQEKTFIVNVHGISGGILAVIIIVSIIIVIFIVLIAVFLKSTYKQKVKFLVDAVFHDPRLLI